MDTLPGYRIDIERRSSPGNSTVGWEDVSNLEELKQALSKYGTREFYLEEYSKYDESRIRVIGPKAVEEFAQSDFDWIIEKPLETVARQIAFKTY